MKARTLLVTGATGLLGANLVVAAAPRWRVIAVARTGQIVLPGVVTAACDILQRDAVVRLIREQRPDAVVHLAAETRVDWCEDHPAEATALNVGGTASVLAAAADTRCRVVYMSTDSVFDGHRGFYGEADTTAPVNVYAETKLQAERLVLGADRGHAVLRSNLFGWNARPVVSLGEWILDVLRDGKDVPGFTDCFFSPLSTRTLAARLLDAVEQELHGLFHAGTSDGVSKFEFARMIARGCGYDPARVQSREAANHVFRARRPLNTSLDSRKLAAVLQVDAPSASEEVAGFCEQWRTGYPATLKSLYIR